MSSTPRAPGQRAGLDRATVVAAARRLIEEGGLERLTMRRLAAELEVLPNALYSHVVDKAALLDAVLDDVLGSIPVPATARGDWRRGLRTLMADTRAVLLAHP